MDPTRLHQLLDAGAAGPLFGGVALVPACRQISARGQSSSWAKTQSEEEGQGSEPQSSQASAAPSRGSAVWGLWTPGDRRPVHPATPLLVLRLELVSVPRGPPHSFPHGEHRSRGRTGLALGAPQAWQERNAGQPRGQRGSVTLGPPAEAGVPAQGDRRQVCQAQCEREKRCRDTRFQWLSPRGREWGLRGRKAKRTTV